MSIIINSTLQPKVPQGHFIMALPVSFIFLSVNSLHLISMFKIVCSMFFLSWFHRTDFFYEKNHWRALASG